MIIPRYFLLLLVIAVPGWAAFQHDFGQGLAYVRITDLAKDDADLQAALTRESVVLDLRATTGSAEAATILAQRLDRTSVPAKGLRIILINPSAAPEIVDAVTRPHSRQITVGPRTPALKADIGVAISIDDDRRAYEALGAENSIEKLVSSTPDKRRFDEAALARTHNNNVLAAATDDDDDAKSTAPKPITPPSSAKPAEPALPRDLVLGRAIQIYRALQVFKH